ncbi:unnamed protein product, partial [Adineta steineri]
RAADCTLQKKDLSNRIIFDTTEATVQNVHTYMEKLLELAQSLISVTDSTTVFVLTQTTSPPIGATFTGFTRVWANEATQHRICSIEFDQEELKKKQFWLERIENMVEKTLEREFIIHENIITVPRHIPRTLTNVLTKTTQEQSSSNEKKKEAFRLEIDTVGQLQTLKYRLFDLPSSLSPNDVEVEVYSSSLNF